MSWVLHGEVQSNNGDYDPLQVGKAAHARFIHTEKPGTLVTVYAYPMAPEVESPGGYDFDMDRVDVRVQAEFMNCADVEDPGGTEEWCDYRYRELGTGPYAGGDDEKVRAAEADALKYMQQFDGGRNILWDGEPFHSYAGNAIDDLLLR